MPKDDLVPEEPQYPQLPSLASWKKSCPPLLSQIIAWHMQSAAQKCIKKTEIGFVSETPSSTAGKQSLGCVLRVGKPGLLAVSQERCLKEGLQSGIRKGRQQKSTVKVEVGRGIVRVFTAASWLAPPDRLYQIFPAIHPGLFHGFVWSSCGSLLNTSSFPISQATPVMVSICHEDLVSHTVEYTEVGTLLFVIYKTSKREYVGISCLKHRSGKVLGGETEGRREPSQSTLKARPLGR